MAELTSSDKLLVDSSDSRFKWLALSLTELDEQFESEKNAILLGRANVNTAKVECMRCKYCVVTSLQVRLT